MPSKKKASWGALVKEWTLGKLLNRKLLFFLAIAFTYLGVAAGSYGRAIVYISSTQEKPVAVGEQMPLNIQIVGGVGVTGYELTVGFDSTSLRYVKSANAHYLPAGAFTVPPIISPNTVYIAATSPAGAAPVSEGVLATLTFEVISIKNSTIELMEVLLSNSAGMPLTVTTENGAIVTAELPAVWDVNEDGKVNIFDLTLVASSLTGIDPSAPRPDINGDGRINVLDLVMVAQHLDAAGRNEDTDLKTRVSLVEFNLDAAYPDEFVRFVSATPPSGSTIVPNVNASITVTFDNAPANVRASAGTVWVAGKTATIAGPFTPGPLALTITWANGTQTLNYTITAPDTNPPTVTGGTIKDGDNHVDPEVINTGGKIEIIFSEDVSGIIALQTEGGDDVGWLPGWIRSKKGVLELVRGKELKNGTIYVVRGRVSDAAGNSASVSVTFVTKGSSDKRADVIEEVPIIEDPTVSFKNDIQPILAERCAIPGCHAAPSAGGLNLSQYDTFKKGGNGGPAFDAGNGKVILVVKRIDGGGMPPIPPPLNADQIQLFIDWIDEGAENN